LSIASFSLYESFVIIKLILRFLTCTTLKPVPIICASNQSFLFLFFKRCYEYLSAIKFNVDIQQISLRFYFLNFSKFFPEFDFSPYITPFPVFFLFWFHLWSGHQQSMKSVLCVQDDPAPSSMSGVKLFFLLLLGVLVCIACVVVGQYFLVFIKFLFYEYSSELSMAKCQNVKFASGASDSKKRHFFHFTLFPFFYFTLFPFFYLN
jgi:hypothetical protein